MKLNLKHVSFAVLIAAIGVTTCARADDKDKKKQSSSSNSRRAQPSSPQQSRRSDDGDGTTSPGNYNSNSSHNSKRNGFGTNRDTTGDDSTEQSSNPGNANRSNRRGGVNDSENGSRSTHSRSTVDGANNNDHVRNGKPVHDSNGRTTHGSQNGDNSVAGGKTHPREGQPNSPSTHGNAGQNVSHARPQPKLEHVATANGGYEKKTASGHVRERMEKKADGDHVQHLSPTGRLQREDVTRADGTRQSTQYDSHNHPRAQVVADKDGHKVEETRMIYGRDGSAPRKTETVKFDRSGKAVSRTVVVQQNNITINNVTVINKTSITRNYVVGRYGYVYRPTFVVSPAVVWNDPYWYTPAGAVVVHPFHYTWGWERVGWYTYHPNYFPVYEVYPTPSYWVTDYVIADYMADQYAATQSAEQAREEARIAREDAEKARAIAEQAKDDAEIAEAKLAQAEAEKRADAAEAKLAADPCRKTGSPIDAETKEQLRQQVETTIAETKAAAEAAQKGTDVVPDLSKALADPKHIFPVASEFKVQQGSVSEGDLLRLEPGQDDDLKTASETTVVKMRVITTKGEEGEVLAGTVVELSLKTLQEFDSEFRAKLDASLAAADTNKDQFKKGI